MRTSQKIQLTNVAEFKNQLLSWSQQFEHIIWLDSNEYPQKYSSYDAVLAVDANTVLKTNYNNAFAELQTYRKQVNDYIFGYLSYDLKNDTEDLSSNNFDGLGFDDLYFFQPKKLFFIKDDVLEIQYLNEYKDDIEEDLETIRHPEKACAERSRSIEGSHKDEMLKSQIHELENTTKTQASNQVQHDKKHDVKIHKRITKKQYLEHLETVLNHIHRGDIYEVNFCQEFYAEDAVISPLAVYQYLNEISTPPFASFLKLEDKYCLSASPERFVKREENKIISQPIKGTAKRLANKKADKKLAEQLANDEKERSENIMIVDLVRNDLSKTATKGSVKVEELCKIYSFEQVHQMISTVVSQVNSDTDSVEIIKTLYPMGSMTGAPKVSAMQIIEKEESTKRSMYSGAIGYFAPNNDFDFSVVIRSILYNESKQYLSYSVGGAITAKSIPEKEYEECLIKAIAMKKVLS